MEHSDIPRQLAGKHFENQKITRELLEKILKGLSVEQLNEIPDGFNNNIIWNVGHILVTQQLLLYALSDNQMNLPEEWIAAFRKGTKPPEGVNEETINQLYDQFFQTVDQAQKDYEKGLFKSYQEYPTSFGVTLRSIEDAIIFNNMHETMHLGYIMALKRAI